MHKVMLRVIKGGFQPADDFSRAELAERRFMLGEIVSAEIRKARNPKFHRLAHRIGQLCKDNIQEFSLCDPHTVLKRLQIEANIACEEIVLRIPELGAVIQRLPKSLSFASMGEEEFRGIIGSMCKFIAEQYWPSLSPEQIEEMAESMVD